MRGRTFFSVIGALNVLYTQFMDLATAPDCSLGVHAHPTACAVEPTPPAVECHDVRAGKRLHGRGAPAMRAR